MIKEWILLNDTKGVTLTFKPDRSQNVKWGELILLLVILLHTDCHTFASLMFHTKIIPTTRPLLKLWQTGVPWKVFKRFFMVWKIPSVLGNACIISTDIVNYKLIHYFLLYVAILVCGCNKTPHYTWTIVVCPKGNGRQTVLVSMPQEVQCQKTSICHYYYFRYLLF